MKKLTILIALIFTLNLQAAAVPVPVVNNAADKQTQQVEVKNSKNVSDSEQKTEENANKKEKNNAFSKLFTQKNKQTAQVETKTPDQIAQIDDLRNKAKFLYNSNNLQESMNTFKQISDADKISDDWLFLANIAQDTGKDIDAVFYLKKAIQIDEKNYKAHYNLGNIYLSEGKTNSAIEEYNKAIKYKKDFSYAYYNKGCALLKREKYFNAKYEFGLAIKYNPSNPAFYYNLAYTYKMLKKPEKADEALKMYEKLMSE